VSGPSGVWLLMRLLSSLAAERDPLSDRCLVGACSAAQLGLGPVPGRLHPGPRVGPAQGETRVLGEEVRPGERPQLLDGLVLVLDPAPAAVPTADSRDLRRQDLVGCAHGSRVARERIV
jgi:hypothetical protein